MTTVTRDDTRRHHEFGAEVGRLLDLVVHSLYSEREIFLRELVANAADAIDRRRFEALTDPDLAPPARRKVRIVPDKPARTLTISRRRHRHEPRGDGRQPRHHRPLRHPRLRPDAGRRQARRTGPSLIGQFGVGFYSAFMVADRVEVTSRRAGSDEAWTWASDGRGGFTMAPATRAEPAGTRRRAASEGRRRRNTSSRSGSRRSCANGPTTSPPDHHRPRRQGRAGQRGHRAVAQAEDPRSPRRATPSSTATSAPCSTSPGRRCTGGPKARWSSMRCCSFPA